MGQRKVEKISVHVPYGEGYLIGDILRKYAIRGVGSWQAIAYRIDSQSPNFGMSNGVMVSYLDLIKGKLHCVGGHSSNTSTEPHLCQFNWNGKCYASGEFELHGISKAMGESLTVCLNFSQGNHSADQNREVLKKATQGKTDGYHVVPSSHSPVGIFRFKVTPIDEKEEWLEIEADEGAAHNALQSVVKSLTGIDI